jgi:hypothetical protein
MSSDTGPWHAQADVGALRAAVDEYRQLLGESQERVERLNVQKQLLIKQVRIKPAAAKQP